MKIFIPAVFAMLFYMSFSQDKGLNHQVEKAFDAPINDSTSIQIDLHYDSNRMPHQYGSHVVTPVCKDGQCYLMVIDIYWDLLGNFKKYELKEDQPLTKFDHVPFSEADHEKMRGILSNKDSFLRFYALDNLIDPNEKRESHVVDGVSGATHKSIQNEVVGGAVYSTYVLWHIVNGPIAKKILDHTESRFTEAMLLELLRSDNYHYQYYALNRIPEADSEEYLPSIIRLISKGIAYVPYFAIEKIPAGSWQSPTVQLQIISLLDELDFEMQNEILNRTNSITLHPDACDVLIAALPKLKDQQLVKALRILKQNKNVIRQESISVIADMNGHNNEISMLLSEILQK